MGPSRFLIPQFIALLLFAGSTLAQQEKEQSATRLSLPEPAASTEVASPQLGADLIKTLTAYRVSLEKLLQIYQQEFKKKVGVVQERRDLYEKGYVSRLELDQSQRELAGAEAKVREVEQKIAETKTAITETTIFEELLRLPPLRAGEYTERGGLIRYNGKAPWSVADTGKIQKFFAKKFGRVLPISALGQTPFHDRMKFDHRDAVDVALHPDSSEGRALMAHLRQAGIPYMAFRNGVPGSASGAHIHIGRPSLRFNSQ
ncbi:MAG: hypothetical protein HYY45_15005 [Deltaproteobacteria bacterium]|nr:hypothetical protein [Deltaproteobacteria bacterium]